MKPIVVEHSFGDPGSGGPISALERLLGSAISDEYALVRMHQARATGGINLVLIRRWVKMLKAVRPDLVHVRGLGNEGFHAAMAARLAGCPNILVSIHGTVRDLTRPSHRLRHAVLTRIIEPYTLRIATDIVAVCHSMETREFLDPVRTKLRQVVPNGVELSRKVAPEARQSLRESLGIPPDAIALVSVGRLSVEKGHLDLAETLALCDADVLARVVLVLVGDGPDADTVLAAYARNPQLQVRSLGRRHDVADVLEAGDIFVFPTLHENLSNALLEAMSAGLPVIATAVGGNVEVLANGGGILVTPGDHRALARAIMMLARDESDRLLLGARAREVVASTYSLDRMVAGWDACYRAVLSNGRSR